MVVDWGVYHEGYCTEPVCGSRRLWTVLPLYCLRKFRVSSEVPASLLFSSIVDVIVLGKFDVGGSSCQMFRINPNMNPVNDVISLLLRQPRSFLLLLFFALLLFKAKPHGYQVEKEHQINRPLWLLHRKIKISSAAYARTTPSSISNIHLSMHPGFIYSWLRTKNTKMP